MSNLIINQLYSFSTLAPSILGASYSSVRLVSIMDYASAVQNKNVELLQKQVEPYLLPGTPTDVKKYQFYKFQTRAAVGPTPAEYIVVADEWVTTEGFVAVTSVDAVVRINNVDAVADIAIITEQLRLLGYTFTVETVTH
jgi:hypothetical protein